jgi:hypothetical protein
VKYVIKVCDILIVRRIIIYTDKSAIRLSINNLK